MDETPAIEALELTRRFGRITAVDRLNLTIARGEIFGLIGPDGAGKTTAIRLLAAVMPATAGRASRTSASYSCASASYPPLHQGEPQPHEFVLMRPPSA